MKVQFPRNHSALAGNRLSRRYFFFGSLMAGAISTAGCGSAPSLKQAGFKSPNEKLNIAAIGAGGRGSTDIKECLTENIVALADPDDVRAAETYKQFLSVPKYKDFRRMFDKQEKEIDAVLVSCPDHTHGRAAMAAIVRGKHVYCQKPLTRTVWEARELARAAVEHGVATQMGNQGYSYEDTRVCSEMIWSGAIGNVTEVHAWTVRPRTYWPQGPEVYPFGSPVPPALDWDVWLGGAEPRPFSPIYAPHGWRAFPDFGSGAIGDMACHILGDANMALRLAAPSSVECVRKEGTGLYTFPRKTTIRFDFPARGTMPPVKIFWYDGVTEQPMIEGLPADEPVGNPDLSGSLFVGDKGMLTAGCYGERPRLVPASRMKEYQFPPPLLTRSPGHYRDWMRAAKGGEPACANFSVSAPFVEWLLLGVIAMRCEGKLEWDARNGLFTNSVQANQYLKPTFREGWDFAA